MSNFTKIVFISLFFILSCNAITERQEVKPIIIGHRGLPLIYPENTKEAFDGLIINGISFVQTDLLMAANDSVMMFHDTLVTRLSSISGRLINTNSDSLKKAMKKKSGGTGLTLNEFITLYQNKFTTIFLEIKQGQDINTQYRVIDQVIAIARKKDLFKKIVVLSTNFYNLQYIRTYEYRLKLGVNNYGISSLDIAIRENFHYAVVHFKNASNELFENAKDANKKLLIFDTKNISEAEKALIAGCDGVITDVPLEMKQLILKEN